MKLSTICFVLVAAFVLIACGGGGDPSTAATPAPTATVVVPPNPSAAASSPVAVVPDTSDTIAPSAPAAFTASSSTSDSISIGWLASTDNVGVVSYEIWRNGARLQATPANQTTFQDNGLTPGTTYTYAVRAVDASGNFSAFGASLNVRTQIIITSQVDTTPPSAPAALAASQVTASSLTISWGPSTDNAGVVRYEVYRDGTILVGSTAQTFFALTGLTANTAYSLTIKAFDAAGNASGTSTALVVSTAAAPATPTPDTTAPSVPTGLAASNATSTSLTIGWAASSDNVGVVNYNVYRDGTLVGSPTATSFTQTGLSASTSYAMTVKAVDAAGNASAASVVLNASTTSAAAASFLLAAGHAQGYLAPVITYPRPDSETAATARHRINYPGQPYRIPVAVAFGSWPFRYELLAAPAGMSIGSQLQASGDELVAAADYGVITWANPTVGTYPISVKVTDQDSVVQTVNFTLKVATSDWVFLDPSVAVNGSGTQASPFNTLASLAGQTGKAVLVRAGTVDWEQKTVGMQNMPKTWLPYDNETVNMSQANSPIGGQGASDLWFSGFKFNIPAARTAVDQFFRFDGGSRIVFFENTFDGGNFSATGASPSNLSLLMWTNQGVGISDLQNAWYSTIMGNTFKNVKDRDMLLGYSMRYTVVENNTVENALAVPYGHGFYPKINVSHFQFRRNTSIGQTNQNVLLRIDAYAGLFPMDYYDVSYNSYRFFGSDPNGDGIGAVTHRDEFGSANITHRYVYRNTLYSGASPASGMSVRGLNTDTVITVSNNLLIGDGTKAGEVWQVQYAGSIVATGNVTGTPATNLVDSNNKLVGAYTSHLGTKGAQVK